jgi:hypothetical protein
MATVRAGGVLSTVLLRLHSDTDWLFDDALRRVSVGMQRVAIEGQEGAVPTLQPSPTSPAGKP